MRVQDHACVACIAGKENEAGDDASGANTQCDTVVCGANHHVQGHQCVACPNGHAHAGGDVQHGSDTSCDEVLCHTNEHVQSHACVACPAGSTNDAGDGAASGDTVCDHTICGANTHVLNHVCDARAEPRVHGVSSRARPPGRRRRDWCRYIVQCHHVWCEPARAEPRVHGVSCRYDERRGRRRVWNRRHAVRSNHLWFKQRTFRIIQPFVVQTRTFRHQRRARRAPSTMPVTTLRLRTLFVTSCSAALTSTCKVINALRVLPVRRTIRATTRLALTRSAIQSSARRTCACKITRVWRA